MICGFLSLCQYAHTLTKGDPGPVRRQSPASCNLERHRGPTPDGSRRLAARVRIDEEKMKSGEHTTSPGVLLTPTEVEKMAYSTRVIS